MTLIDEDVKDHARRYPIDEFPGHAAWVDGRYKLHRLPGDKEPTFELYDLIADAAEAHDLASSEPRRVADMRAALDRWQRSVLHSLNGGDDRARDKDD